MLNKREVNTWKYGNINIFEGITPSEYDNSTNDSVDFIKNDINDYLELNDGTTATLFQTFKGEIIALEDQEY